MIAPLFRQNLQELADLLPRLGDLNQPLTQLSMALMDCWQRGGKVLMAGNGGSAADAMHFAEELVVRFHRNRKALAALALCDPTVLTCAGNDMGYDSIFSRQVEALGRPGDILVVLTTSGNSRNIVAALELAKKLSLTTVGFLGKDGGACRNLCDISLVVPSPTTARIQEVHKLMYHTICHWVEDQLTGAK